MTNLQRYNHSMDEESLREWAEDAQEALDKLKEEMSDVFSHEEFMLACAEQQILGFKYEGSLGELVEDMGLTDKEFIKLGPLISITLTESELAEVERSLLCVEEQEQDEWI